MNHACHAAGAQLASSGLILPGSIVLMSLEELYRVSGLTDFFRIIYRELNHLRDLGLLDPRGAGFGTFSDSTTAQLTPSPLALHMFVRLSGHLGDPLQFFGLTRPETPSPRSGLISE
jgi:hypothetical protein